MTGAFEEGYIAGLVNERDNPYSAFTHALSHWLWVGGNDVGVRIHCAVVEAVYVATVDA